MLLYLMAARYITGSGNFAKTSSRVSSLAANVASGVLADPRKLEGVINVVRTAAPLCSEQTVSKINTYLPVVERMSTLFGLYSFLSKAQNYAPIQSLSAKSPEEKVSALLSGNSLPIGKLLAQPLISKNMDKIVSSVAQNVIGSALKNGDLDKMISSMAKQFTQGDGSSSDSESAPDLSSLMETFMPLIGSILGGDGTDSSNAQETESECESFEPAEAPSEPEEEEPDIRTVQEEAAKTAEPPYIVEEPVQEEPPQQRNTAPMEIRPRRRTRRY